MSIAGFICTSCGEADLRRGYYQRYCRKCSTQKSIERQRRYSNSKGLLHQRKARSQILQRGIEINKDARSTIFGWKREISPFWASTVSIPFNWNGSKNAIYSLRSGGHVWIREQAKAYKQTIIDVIRRSVADQNIVQAKVWIDIFVQKPNHRGDAANFVDLVLDAIKIAIGVDDRWFCLGRVDWEISKTDPRIYIVISQEATENSQVCSSCGRILPFTKFHKNKGTKAGVSRNCTECSSGRHRRCGQTTLR